MGDFFELVLDGTLELQDAIFVLGSFDHLQHFLRVSVNTRLEERLGVVKAVVVDVVTVNKELCELIVAISRVDIILNLEVAISQKGEGSSVSGLELQLSREDVDDVQVLLVTD